MSDAPLVSPKLTTPVLLMPATSVIVVMSRTSRSLSIATSYATNTTDANASEAVAAITPIAVSLCASDKSRNRCLMLDMLFVPDDPREAQQLRAELEPRALRGGDVDDETHAPALQDQLGDAAQFGESVRVARREHRGSFQSLDQLKRPLLVEPPRVEHMTRPDGSVGFDQLDGQLVALDRVPFDRLFERVGDRVGANDAKGDSLPRSQRVGGPFREL